MSDSTAPAATVVPGYDVASDTFNVTAEDVAEMIGALLLASKVHAATGDTVMAEHYADLADRYAERTRVALAARRGDNG